MSNTFDYHFFAGARVEAQAGAIGEALEAQGLHPGRIISSSKSYYSKQHPGHIVFFNACIFVKERRWLKVIYRQVWWGDIDLTESQAAVVAAADACGHDLYVTREKYSHRGKPDAHEHR